MSGFPNIRNLFSLSKSAFSDSFDSTNNYSGEYYKKSQEKTESRAEMAKKTGQHMDAELRLSHNRNSQPGDPDQAGRHILHASVFYIPGDRSQRSV